jgi:post-segregation antitoxin (ccd killing protein)
MAYDGTHDDLTPGAFMRILMRMRRPINLTLSEDIVAQARHYTGNLSASVEELLADYVTNQRESQASMRQMAQSCAADWNAVHDAVGSFADEHSTL